MNETVHSARKAPKRTNDPERTMAGIMAVATAEFAAKGLAGARIDAIAAATHTSKRMIYYYYGSKEGLYLAVLEDAYRRIRATEAELHLADLSPVEALKARLDLPTARRARLRWLVAVFAMVGIIGLLVWPRSAGDAALLALAGVPVVAGLVRLAGLMAGQASADAARFFDHPLPVTLHILAVIPNMATLSTSASSA